MKHADLVIIGGGPAGLTAGIYASRSRIDTLLIEKAATGGQVLLTDWIEIVWDSVPTEISGFFSVENVTLKNLKTDIITFYVTQ